MEKIYSKVNEKITHIFIPAEYLKTLESRVEVCEPHNPLQLALLNLKKDQTFKAHYHLSTKKKTVGTQEA